MKKNIIIVAAVVFFCLLYIHSTPSFCGALSVVVEKNDSIHDVASSLKENKCIRSKKLFEAYGVILNIRVQEGLYAIPRSQSVFEYLYIFTSGDYRQNVKLTIPEGSTNKEIAAICNQKIPTCSREKFLEKSKNNEGFMFPNTYYFFGTESEDAVIDVMKKEFLDKTKELFSDVSEIEKRNIVIMASILEKEANNPRDMALVAGILNNRLAIDMPLQVDATLFYERGKTSAQLSINDLSQDSPFNTYTNKGLPPSAIANPGLLALTSAKQPTHTNYLYYLTGKDGKMYYARTHDEHVKNKELYLR